MILLFALLNIGILSNSVAATCEDAFEKFLAGVTFIQPLKCNPLDPACASIKRKADEIRVAQYSAKSSCRERAKAKCATYAREMSAGKAPDAAWSIAMNGCTPSIHDMPKRAYNCLCDVPEANGTPPSPTAPPPTRVN